MRNSILSRSSGRMCSTAESSSLGKFDAGLSFTREQNRTLNIASDSFRWMSSSHSAEKRFRLAVRFRRADVDKSFTAFHAVNESARDPVGKSIAFQRQRLVHW